MSLYSLRGSEELDARIAKDLERIAEVTAPYSLAGILLGGYGRGEGTPFINPDGSQSPFNDYDLVVVVDRIDHNLHQAFNALEQQLAAELGIAVDLYPYRQSRLPKCEFSMLNYEMKHGHMVVWGNKHILDAMPAYPHNAIPLSEGTRLLLNRGKLLFDIKLRLATPAALTEEERIRFIKFIYKAWLALGDCSLLVERNYDILYSVKRIRIANIENVPHRSTVIEKYIDAIDLKEWGDYLSRLSDIDITKAYREVRDVFVDFFRWYREQYSTYECSILKAMLLNLKWNRWPYFEHPRTRLYDALPELLNDEPDKILLGQILSRSHDCEKRFYELQARFA